MPENPYFQEHLRYGLPGLATIEAWLRSHGLTSRVESITRFNIWLLALALNPLQEIRPEIYREVTRCYNHRFQELDHGEPSNQSLIEIAINSGSSGNGVGNWYLWYCGLRIVGALLAAPSRGQRPGWAGQARFDSAQRRLRRSSGRALSLSK